MAVAFDVLQEIGIDVERIKRAGELAYSLVQEMGGKWQDINSMVEKVRESVAKPSSSKGDFLTRAIIDAFFKQSTDFAKTVVEKIGVPVEVYHDHNNIYIGRKVYHGGSELTHEIMVKLLYELKPAFQNNGLSHNSYVDYGMEVLDAYSAERCNDVLSALDVMLDGFGDKLSIKAGTFRREKSVFIAFDANTLDVDVTFPLYDDDEITIGTRSDLETETIVDFFKSYDFASSYGIYVEKYKNVIEEMKNRLQNIKKCGII